ncbi:polysaccharide deacetylase family protein [Alsobacter sp. SYSU M60028]|uniref:Chitooligosaccharide deacetylase n=1 Tax=Alsobacter ponti TaxID=2962936 RepID=A0ABT1LDQ6_9HYPH|nr:polysaccharide deacetylase family protein [Alsobacter ponti]MCP8939023.1 polysaccharide deacetylase family protein [Alsobacter ponti]
MRPRSLPTPIPRRHALAGLAAGAAGLLLGGDARAGAACPSGLAGRVLPVGVQGGLAVGLKSYPAMLPLADREMVLTFDDGPIPGPTSRVLDALACAGARATFFVIGRNASANAALLRRIRAEGHTVACHTYSHPWTLREMRFEAAKRDIEAGFDAIAQALGESAAPFFRFPGFADTPALLAWLASRDIGVFGCDLWASDWSPMSPEQELELTLGRLAKARRGIVLFHDVQARTASMLPRFLTAAAAQGFRAVHMVPGPGRLSPEPAGPGWSSDTERMIAIARRAHV